MGRKSSIKKVLYLQGIYSQNLFAQSNNNFSWPQDKEAAISLSFDDGRYSQVEGGTAFLDSLHVKATFYVVPAAVEERLAGWKKQLQAGMKL